MNVINSAPSGTYQRRIYMQSLSAIFVCAAVFAGSVATQAQSNAKEEAAVRDVVSNFAESWNRAGMPGFSDLFTDDADFVVITGKWLKGRSEIVSYHKELLGSLYKGSHLAPDTVTVRFLQPDVAVAHANWEVSYTKDGNEQKRTALMTLTFTKQAGKWQIAAAHNTLTGGPGAMGH
jgi:uncharacterized protein (TIGR02246 family)